MPVIRSPCRGHAEEGKEIRKEKSLQFFMDLKIPKLR